MFQQLFTDEKTPPEKLPQAWVELNPKMIGVGTQYWNGSKWIPCNKKSLFQRLFEALHLC
jgi:hypothetical protein